MAEKAENSKRNQADIDQRGGITLEGLGNAACGNSAFSLPDNDGGKDEAKSTADAVAELLKQVIITVLHDDNATKQSTVEAGKGKTGGNQTVCAGGNEVEQEREQSIEKCDGNDHDKGTAKIGVLKKQVGEGGERTAEKRGNDHHHREQHRNPKKIAGRSSFDQQLTAAESPGEDDVFNGGSPK